MVEPDDRRPSYGERVKEPARPGQESVCPNGVKVSVRIKLSQNPNGPIGTAVIPPHGTNTFIPPAVEGVPLNWKTGTLSVTLRYGHASGQPQYRVHWEFDVQGRRQPGLAQSDIELDVGMVNAPEVEDI